MDVDEEKVDDMVLALLYLTTFEDKPRLRAWKRAQLGRPRSSTSEGLHLRSGIEGKISLID